MGQILSERDADQEVIHSLLREIARLKGKLMSKTVLFKDDQGNINSVVSFESVSREVLVANVTEAEQALKEAQKAVYDYDTLAGLNQEPTIEETPAPAEEVPAIETPVEQPAEVVTPDVITVNEQLVEVPADGTISIDLTPEQPVVTETPAEAPVEHTAPEVAEPAGPAPIIIQ